MTVVTASARIPSSPGTRKRSGAAVGLGGEVISKVVNGVGMT